MMLTTTTINKYILRFAFLLLGTGKAVAYFPAFVLYFAITPINLKKIHFDANFIILFFLVTLSFLPLYTYGVNNLTIDRPFNSFVGLAFSVWVAGLLLSQRENCEKRVLIALYIIGFGLISALVTSFSFLERPLSYGYGSLIDPFTGEEINSPAVSNSLSIFSVLLVIFLGSTKSVILWIFSAFVLLINIAMGIYLGGRTYFIIISISLIYIALRGRLIKNLIILTAVILSLLIIGSFLYEDTVIIQYYSDFLLNRFRNGIESGRFALYKQGLGELLYYPVGGFSVDRSIDSTYWFHNVFLDNARIAGWLPVLMLASVILFIFLKAVKKHTENRDIGVLMFIISILIMSQDVVFEGNYKPFVLMYFCGVLLIAKAGGGRIRHGVASNSLR